MASIIVPPPGRPRRPLTVYECAACSTRAVGEQRCGDRGTFMARVGLGGQCPHCDEPVAVADPITGEVLPTTITSCPHRSIRAAHGWGLSVIKSGEFQRSATAEPSQFKKFTCKQAWYSILPGWLTDSD